jgi:predicted DCC family thiol-disulfide oxidoreductase YuxK
MRAGTDNYDTGRPLVVFDGDCAFCTSGINRAMHWFPGSFDVVPYQRTDLAALGLTSAECRERLQWLTDPTKTNSAGNRRTGAQAVTAILRVGGRQRGGAGGTAARIVGAIASIPPLSWLAAAAYWTVAANRSRLPGGTPACKLPPSLDLSTFPSTSEA